MYLCGAIQVSKIAQGGSVWLVGFFLFVLFFFLKDTELLFLEGFTALS